MIALLLTRWRFGLSIAAALALLGLIGALSHYRHAYHAEKALRQADRAAYVNAQAVAALRARQALDAAEDRYRSKADVADHAYQTELADARTADGAYIALHRVRGQAIAGSASGTAASASGGNSSVPADVPANAFVAVSEGDVQACTDASAYAVAAHNWALTLGR